MYRSLQSNTFQMTINDDIVKMLEDNSIPITAYFVLYSIANSLNWYKQLREDRITNLQYLIRRKLITADLKITSDGEKLLGGQLKSPVVAKALNVKELQHEWQLNFAEFWNLYPTSDKFKHWPRTRALRINKAKSFQLYCNILSKKEYSAEDLKGALLADIKSKSETSVMENQFKYLQAITSWLSKGIYEGYISENNKHMDSKDDDRTIFE